MKEVSEKMAEDTYYKYFIFMGALMISYNLTSSADVATIINTIGISFKIEFGKYPEFHDLMLLLFCKEKIIKALKTPDGIEKTKKMLLMK